MTTADTDQISVVLVDDHGIIREGTRHLLEQDPRVRVAGETGDRDEAIRLGVELRPDVMLVDIQLDGANGIDVVREVTARSPETRCLMLTAYDDSVYVSEAFAAGASGYLLKSAGTATLIAAVHAVASGAAVIDDRVSRRMQSRGMRGAAPPVERLTPREDEVLRLLARGHSNKEIAREMGLGVRTVEGHVSNVLAKCAVHTRTEAILYAVTHQLVSLAAPDRG